MGKRKTVENEHVAFLKTYFSKKLVDGTLDTLLKPAADHTTAGQALQEGLQSEDPEQLNQWFDDYLSNEGRKTVWTAFRSAGFRRKNPRSEQELRRSVAKDVMTWADAQGIDDLNEAVLALLKSQET